MAIEWRSWRMGKQRKKNRFLVGSRFRKSNSNLREYLRCKKAGLPYLSKRLFQNITSSSTGNPDTCQMAPKPMSVEERRKHKREAEKRRRDQIKLDPVKYEAAKAKESERRGRRIEAKKIQKIRELSPTDQNVQREEWRKRRKKFRAKRKEREQQLQNVPRENNSYHNDDNLRDLPSHNAKVIETESDQIEVKTEVKEDLLEIEEIQITSTTEKDEFDYQGESSYQEHAVVAPLIVETLPPLPKIESENEINPHGTEDDSYDQFGRYIASLLRETLPERAAKLQTDIVRLVLQPETNS